METRNQIRDIGRWVRAGFGFSLAVGLAWTAASFAAAAWGALPTVGSGTTLSSTAWNDVVGQVNTIAWVMSVTSGHVGIGAAPGIPGWTPGVGHRMFEITGLGQDTIWSNGVLLLTDNRPTTGVGDQEGAILFSPKNDQGGVHSAIASYVRGSGGANGFGSDLAFYTKADNVVGNVSRLYINSSGSVGIGTNAPQSTFQIVGNYVQIPSVSGTAPLSSDCDQAAEAGRMVIYTASTLNPSNTQLYVCPQGATGASGWVVK